MKLLSAKTISLSTAGCLVLVTLVSLGLLSSCGNATTDSAQVPGIKFDTSGWQHQSISDKEEKWTDKQDVITLTHSTNSDPLLNPPQEGDLRKARGKELEAKGSAIIELDVMKINGKPVVHYIYKEPQQQSGMRYTGQVLLPQADGTLYAIQVVAPESGVTGMREAMILDKMMGSKEVSLDPKTGEMTGWSANPYDPDDHAQLKRNKAEDPKFDPQFPDHPLSRTRAILKRIESSVRLGPKA